MTQAYVFVNINEWSDLPKVEGVYWTLNKNPHATTMIQNHFDPSDKANRGFWRATVGIWLKPISILNE